MIFFLLDMDIILKKNLFTLKTIRQNVLLVKEELQKKKLKGINVRPRGRFKFKYIFYRKERVKRILNLN